MFLYLFSCVFTRDLLFSSDFLFDVHAHFLQPAACSMISETFA